MTTVWDIVKDGVVIGRRDVAPIGDQAALAPSKPRILPRVEVRPDYDPVSEALDGPVVEIGSVEVTYTWTKRAKNAGEIATMAREKDEQIEAEFERRWAAPIEHAVNGIAYRWHADRDAVTNIMGVMLSAQARGLSTSTVRTWTPCESNTPVEVTIADVIAIGLAIVQRKDALFAIKKVRQAALAAMSAAEIDAIDASVGWE